MLIENGNLDFEEFKKFLNKLEWKKVPRKLGPDHSEYFYIANYEDEEKKIRIQVRPSLRMKVTESFKNRTIHGNIPPEGYRGQLVDFGSTAEVLIDKSVIEKLKKIAKSPDKNNTKVFSLE